MNGLKQEQINEHYFNEKLYLAGEKLYERQHYMSESIRIIRGIRIQGSRHLSATLDDNADITLGGEYNSKIINMPQIELSFSARVEADRTSYSIGETTISLDLTGEEFSGAFRDRIGSQKVFVICEHERTSCDPQPHIYELAIYTEDESVSLVGYNRSWFYEIKSNPEMIREVLRLFSIRRRGVHCYMLNAPNEEYFDICRKYKWIPLRDYRDQN